MIRPLPLLAFGTPGVICRYFVSLARRWPHKKQHKKQIRVGNFDDASGDTFTPANTDPRTDRPIAPGGKK